MLKVYADLLSQPSRAVILFLKLNKIPHEFKPVSIMRAEHRDPEYIGKIHPFGRVPAIDDDGFKVMESIAILRYLAQKYKVDEPWYPKDIAKQAKVDEFLEWQHIGLRSPLATFFRIAFVKPMLTGKPAKEEHETFWKSRLEMALDEIESVWLKSNPYLTGNSISVADLIGISEIEQPRMSKIDPTVNRPKLAAWMKRVRQELQPHYDEVMIPFNKIVDSQSKL